jgi:hypothetical protein
MGKTLKNKKLHKQRSADFFRKTSLQQIKVNLDPAPYQKQWGEPSSFETTQLTPVVVMQLHHSIGNRAAAEYVNRASTPRQVQKAKVEPRPASERGSAQKELGFEVSEEFENRLQANNKGGKPLDQGVRSYFEPRFGFNLNSVRLHTGGEASALSRSIDAKAFTYGNNIYLNQDKSETTSPGIQRLLAHELAHVVQQERSGIRRVMRWGGLTHHHEVTKEAFDTDPDLIKWYSPHVRKHLASMSDKMDLRVAFIHSYSKGGSKIGPESFNKWVQEQRKAELDIIKNMPESRLNEFVSGAKAAADGYKKTEDKYEELITLKKSALGIKNPIKRLLKGGDTFRDWRIKAAQKNIPNWKEQNNKQINDAAQEHLSRIGDPRFDPEAYDKMIVERLEGEPENHAEGGRYQIELQNSAEGKSISRVQEYQEQAVQLWHGKNIFAALQTLGLGLHATEDRGAHGDGKIGYGHDPRRLTEPPKGNPRELTQGPGVIKIPETAYAFKEKTWKASYCDSNLYNSKGYFEAVDYAQELLRDFYSHTMGLRKKPGQITGSMIDPFAGLSTFFGGGAIRPRNWKFTSGTEKTKQVDKFKKQYQELAKEWKGRKFDLKKNPTLWEQFLRGLRS